jgi:hypothetical protein
LGFAGFITPVVLAIIIGQTRCRRDFIPGRAFLGGWCAGFFWPGEPLDALPVFSIEKNRIADTEAFGMTVIERLRSAGAQEDEAQRAAAVIAAVLPVDRNVRVTEEILDAARAGDIALVSMLLAEEVDAEPDEVAALEAADRENDDARSTETELRRRLGL